MDRIRLGIVGTGLIWEHVHRPVVDSMPGRYEVVALCARKQENHAKWKRRYPDARIYGRYEDLLDDAAVDVVVVATPIHLNGEVTLAALKAGKDVFEEKPMCLGSDEAAEILRAQQIHGKRVYMLEQFLYDAKVSYIADMIRHKKMGDFILFNKITHYFADSSDDHTVGYFQTDWRINPEYPLGLLFDSGAHEMAVLIHLYGMPASIYASGVKIREGFGEYDCVMMSFHYEDGSSGLFSHSAYLEPSQNGDTIFFTKGTVRISGHEVQIVYNDGSSDTISFQEENLYALMWAQLHTDYVNTEAGICSAEQGADVIRVFDAIAQSISTGESVQLRP